MDYIETLHRDSGLADLLCDVCDVEILSEFRTPQDEDGHLTYNISGETFAREGSGGEYILLADGSVGYWGSEGQCGRLADSLRDFFELVVNCPYWQNYIDGEYFEGTELEEFAKEIFEEYLEDSEEIGFDLREAQRELSDSLGIEKKTDVSEILTRFYQCARREPRLVSTYRENDGSTHSGSGSVLERE